MAAEDSPKTPFNTSGVLSWQPILEGKRAVEARESIGRVLDELRTDEDILDPRIDRPSATAGYALTFAYAARSLERPDLLEVSRHFIDAAVEEIASQGSWPALHGGFVGVAWTATHLSAMLGEKEAEDAYDEIDGVLIDYVEGLSTDADYDLISGLVGVGIYALERWPALPAQKILERVVDKLLAMSRRDQDGITWLTPSHRLPEHHRETAPNGYYNLGLAHGIPGIIGLLGRASGVDALDTPASQALEESVEWLLSKAGPMSDGLQYTSWISPGPEPDRAARIAWCYGDLGLSAALLVAGQSHGREDWCDAALSFARNCAELSEQESSDRDHGLCHGAAGNAHLFNRMAQLSGDEVLIETARFWYDLMLDTRTSSVGIGGYLSWRGKNPNDTESEAGYVRDPEVLTGAAGVVLSLAAGLSNVDPAWDRTFLISGHARERKPSTVKTTK